WNTFLGAFGLSLAPTYVGLGAGNRAVSSPHPIFAGVTVLFQQIGQDIRSLYASNPLAQVLVSVRGDGLYAAYDASLASIAAPYTYDVVARDPDSDSLTYSLITAPPEMTIDRSSGHIGWAPTSNDVGDHPVSVRVDDGHGGFDTQSFVVHV